jgi:hypothetical protein
MSHTHHCVICMQPVAVCDSDTCQHEGPQYCTVHHPDPAFKVEDKATVRMTVRVDNSEAK